MANRNSVINGIPDWVYEEEFGFDRALEFSADNTLIAFYPFRRVGSSSYSFPVFAGQAPRIDALKIIRANIHISIRKPDIRIRK